MFQRSLNSCLHRNAVWREKLQVDMEKTDAQNNVGLFLSLIDCNTKKYMGKCIIPVDNLIFGEQFNMVRPFVFVLHILLRCFTHTVSFTSPTLFSLLVFVGSHPEQGRFLLAHLAHVGKLFDQRSVHVRSQS